MNVPEVVANAFTGRRGRAAWILLVGTPLLLVWKYYADPAAWAPLAEGTDWPPETVGAVGYFLGSFLLLGVVPALCVTLAFRQRLSDYGVGLGAGRRTVRISLIGLPLFLLAAWLGSRNAEIAAVFPINPLAGRSPGTFALHVATYLLFYAGWEFCFRGFLLFGLRDVLGDVPAVLIQVMASSLVHIGSPASETFGAIPAGIFWGICALRSRSLLPSLLQHACLGVFLDVFLCFGDG